MAKVKLSMEEWHNVVKSLNKLLHLLYDALKERDSFRKQRDELINDMAEVKKKTEILDEIVKALYKYDSPKDFGDLVWEILIDYGVIHPEE
ncbi:hypothetical protein HMPREF2741_10185 [Staphylococcus sp. HMSC074C12]|uniref:hypothetical protein n=1 Tax=Staphylococcus TaxID=1279 RepID=UPI00069D19A7|nr:MULTISPECIES: hypothetical protein [Staphylococcus]MDT3948438.1 hypothetical protein [Staphylococcus haemolyticus]OHQ79425.1 hypothetical protein HMPREF2741_10185 [Staphylococcus sp. HMSC074C12]